MSEHLLALDHGEPNSLVKPQPCHTSRAGPNGVFCLPKLTRERACAFRGEKNKNDRSTGCVAPRILINLHHRRLTLRPFRGCGLPRGGGRSFPCVCIMRCVCNTHTYVCVCFALRAFSPPAVRSCVRSAGVVVFCMRAWVTTCASCDGKKCFALRVVR